MTIASEITRLQWAKSDARDSIINKWVNVPNNAKLDTYHDYIDLIQTWVPQEDYDTFVSMAKWAALWYPDISYTANHRFSWWDSYLCKIGNYIFMIWWYAEYFYSNWHTYFDWYVWIYYKIEWANSWSWCKLYFWRLDSRDSTSSTVNLTPVYDEATNTVNIEAKIVWNRWDTITRYLDWVVGSNTISQSSIKTWESLNNYKIYNSSISVWEIDPNDIYAVWYIIDDPLL